MDIGKVFDYGTAAIVGIMVLFLLGCAVLILYWVATLVGLL